jgi:hypothetical protein
MRVTVTPETVQTVFPFETKLTGRPELAVAATWNGDTDRVLSLKGAKLIV